MPTITQIQQAVADHFGLTMVDMTRVIRQVRFTQPRQIAMFLARQMTGHSYPVIGRAFQRDHATIIHAETRVRDMIMTSPAVVDAVAMLVAQLRDDP